MATVKDDTKGPEKPEQEPKGDLERSDEGARSFANALTEWEDGQFHADLTKELQRLNALLREHARIRGKAKGEMILTVRLDVDEGDVVSITTGYKIKTPTPPRRKSTMWLTPGGNLSRSNPKQLEFGLRQVAGPAMKDAPEKPVRTRGDRS